MKYNETADSVHNEPSSQTKYESENNNVKENDLQNINSSEEYYELISQIDPDAEADSFYKTSLEFFELRARLGKELRHNFWIAVGLGLVISSVAYVAL